MTNLQEKKPTRSDVEKFYDATVEQRVRDFIYGNRRIEAAMAFVRSRIGKSTRKVLEVGCGLGITAAHLAKEFDWIAVHAIDISPKTIDAAKRLFETDSRLQFEVDDMTAVPSQAPYDLITLLDVYEHIPPGARPGFHAVLGRSLAETGAVILTFPSPTHQEFLAANKPSGLQVVDETIVLDHIIALAEAVGGTITHYSMQSIWNRYDYVHCIIDRDLTYGRAGAASASRRTVLGRLMSKVAGWRRFLGARRHRRIVTSRLGLKV